MELEAFWQDVLSESPELVRARLQALEPAERRAVLDHLAAMATQPGWSEGQRRRACFALEAFAPEDTRKPPAAPPG